jgi:hypothetical protein
MQFCDARGIHLRINFILAITVIHTGPDTKAYGGRGVNIFFFLGFGATYATLTRMNSIQREKCAAVSEQWLAVVGTGFSSATVQFYSERQCCLHILNCHVKCYVRSLCLFRVYTREISPACGRQRYYFQVIVYN